MKAFLTEPRQCHLPLYAKLVELVRDASRFVQTFVSSIEEHPLFVYLTALPFAPIETLLYKTFMSPDVPWVVGGFNKSWPSLLQMTQVAENLLVNYVAFFADGTRFITSSGNLIRVWDANTGAEVLSPLAGHTADVNSSVVSTDGLRIVSGSDDHTVRLWDATTGEALQSLTGHSGAVLTVAICSVGTRIASGSVDKTVQIWTTTSACVTLAHGDTVRSVAFTPDGQHLVSGSDDKIVRVWDVISGGEPIYQLQGHGDLISSVAVSPDGNSFASSSWDCTIRIWDTSSHSSVFKTKGSSHLYSVAFFPDGKHVSAISCRRVSTWDLTSDTQTFISAPHKFMNCMALSPNGEQLLLGYSDGTVGLWDATVLNAEASDLEANNPITAISFTPDGQLVALCSQKDSKIRLWNTESGVDVMTPLPSHEDFIRCLAMSPCGEFVASGSWGMTIRVWNLSSGAEILTLRGHEDFISCLVFSPDGMQIASGSKDRTVRLWSSTSGSQIMSPLCGHKDNIKVLQFSSDGTRLLSGDWRGSVCLWDIISGTQITCFSMPHDYRPKSVTFSADGHYIIVKCWPGIFIWDIDQACLTPAPDYLHPACTLKDSIIVTPDLWIVDVATRMILGKLPSIVSIDKYTASTASIAFTTQDRDSTVFIMHFPPNVFTSPMSWDPTVYKYEPLYDTDDENLSDSDDSDGEESPGGKR